LNEYIKASRTSPCRIDVPQDLLDFMAVNNYVEHHHIQAVDIYHVGMAESYSLYPVDYPESDMVSGSNEYLSLRFSNTQVKNRYQVPLGRGGRPYTVDDKFDTLVATVNYYNIDPKVDPKKQYHYFISKKYLADANNHPNRDGKTAYIADPSKGIKGSRWLLLHSPQFCIENNYKDGIFTQFIWRGLPNIDKHQIYGQQHKWKQTERQLYTNYPEEVMKLFEAIKQKRQATRDARDDRASKRQKADNTNNNKNKSKKDVVAALCKSLKSRHIKGISQMRGNINYYKEDIAFAKAI
jgi:hypothetical protein